VQQSAPEQKLQKKIEETAASEPEPAKEVRALSQTEQVANAIISSIESNDEKTKKTEDNT
jgi:hypothetical protein